MNTEGIFKEAREMLVDTCRLLSARGYLAGVGGNVAYRVSEEAFLITPSATDYSEMDWQDICVLDLATRTRLDGRLAPSVESGLHAALLRARPELRASIHTHQPVASATALLAEPIPCIGEEERILLGTEVPVAPYAPSGTRMLVRSLARTLRPRSNAYLLRSHGVIAAAMTMDAAIRAVELVEEAASRHLRNLIQGNTGLPDHLKNRVLTTLNNDRSNP